MPKFIYDPNKKVDVATITPSKEAQDLANRIRQQHKPPQPLTPQQPGELPSGATGSGSVPPGKAPEQMGVPSQAPAGAAGTPAMAGIPKTKVPGALPSPGIPGKVVQPQKSPAMGVEKPSLPPTGPGARPMETPAMKIASSSPAKVPSSVSPVTQQPKTVTPPSPSKPVSMPKPPAAKPVATPARPPSTPMVMASKEKGNYSLRVGAYLFKSSLKDPMEKVVKLGFEPEVNIIKRRVPMNRVTVGNFQSQEVAEAAIKDLAEEGIKATIFRKPTGTYSAITGTFFYQKEAEQQKRRLEEFGFDVFIEQVKVLSNLQELRVGSYISKQAAQDDIMRLKSQGLEPVVVSN